MTTRLLLSLVYLHTLVFIGRSDRTIPTFNRQFLTRYVIQDLKTNVCTITEEVVVEEQNCVDCMLNISSVLLTDNGNRIYIGAKSSLLSADLDECKSLNNLPWMGAVADMNCGKWECGNFITQIIELDETHLLACGTNYGNPDAILIRPDGLMLLDKIPDVPRLCAQSPTWGASYLQLDNQIFVGANEDEENSAITMFKVNQYLDVSTENAVTTDSKMLDEAKYIASFEHGDFVYFVMREKSDGVHVASIGRICRSDPGYNRDQSPIEHIFLTFTKTYITCTMTIDQERDEVLQFKVVTAATFNPESGYIYATFTQYLDVDIGGYAVCSYSIEDVDETFMGEYQTVGESGAPLSAPLVQNINCETYRSELEAEDKYVTTGTVAQKTEFPLYYELKKFTSLLSDHVGSSTVLYIGTNTGTIEKLIITKDQAIVLVSEFVLAESHVPVTSMQFSNNAKRMLVASTEDSVSRFPVEQCTALLELGRCIGIRDPHCCWCKTSHSCSHIDDCNECVNDPVEGRVTKAFGRMTEYQWEREDECEPICNEVEESCDLGERIVRFMQVYPKITEVRQERRNCTYTGAWTPFQPKSDNVTAADRGANEARLGLKEGSLFKILAAVFGSLFIVSLFIIVFLMFYKSSNSHDNLEKSKQMISRANSNNIISDKPISYMPSTKTGDTQQMMSLQQQNRMIMPQGLDKINNSPYHSHMTPEDERLLQVRIADPSENMYSDVYNQHGAQTLPRNFGNSPSTLTRAAQQHPGNNFSQTLQRPNNMNRFYTQQPNQDFIPQEFIRHAPNMLS